MRSMRSVRGGVVLDVVVAAGLILLTGFALERIGVTLPQLLAGFRHFVRG
jgi:hypothetical protein